MNFIITNWHHPLLVPQHPQCTAAMWCWVNIKIWPASANGKVGKCKIPLIETNFAKNIFICFNALKTLCFRLLLDEIWWSFYTKFCQFKHLHLILCCQVMNHFRVRFYLLETNFVDSPWGILSGPYNIIIVPLELSAHCYTTTGYF